MFMAANSPLIQQRLQLLVSQGAWILKPFPLIEGRVLETSLAMQVWLSLQLFCAEHIKAFALSGAVRSLPPTEHREELVPSLSVCNQHRRWITCTGLQPEPGLTASRARHLETLEFIGGSLKWFKFDLK